MSVLQVSCATYTGSLAQLSICVLSGQVDVHAVRLSRIAEQVVAAILALESPLGPDEAGTELVLCAGLLRYKSRCLLPAVEDEEQQVAIEGILDEEQLTVERLDCQDIKVGVDVLEGLAMFGAQLYTRGMPEQHMGHPPLLQTSLMSLVVAMQDLLLHAESLTMEIPRDEYTVAAAMEYLEDVFNHQVRLKVSDLFQPGSSRLQIIVVFLGLLELIRLGRVELVESECGDLLLCSQEEGRVA